MSKGTKPMDATVLSVDLSNFGLSAASEARVAESLVRSVLSEVVLSKPGSVTVISSTGGLRQGGIVLPPRWNGGIFIRNALNESQWQEAGLEIEAKIGG